MNIDLVMNTADTVRPLAGAGIEIVRKDQWVSLQLFAPSRGRELKYALGKKGGDANRFAPSRGRELK